MTATDERFMAHALAIGARGLGRVWPNPAVGCVIVNERRVVGRGWTQPGGAPHAETVALTQAGPAARGATVYVTLEPCSHQGRTPPCADALIAAGPKRVVVAMKDPNPEVDGKGLQRLAAAGIEVTTGVLADRARLAHRGFVSRIDRGRPWISLKLAASLDGRIATASGESKWITGPAARSVVQGLRARHDAVMVGGGTARADDPALTLRGFGRGDPPVRIVWTRRLDLPLDGQLARTAAEVPLWLLHGPDARPETRAAWQGLGARLFEVPVGQGRELDPAAALAALGTAGLTRVLCEGGGALGASLLAAGLVDEIQLFTAGLTLGAEGRPALGSLGLGRLADAQRFELVEVRAVSGDVLSVWRRPLTPE